MGGRVKFALHGSSIDRSRASALSPDAGKLSYAASSIARGDLLFRRARGPGEGHAGDIESNHYSTFRTQTLRGSIVCKISDNTFSKLRITRAYIKLLCIPEGGARTVSLAQIGNYEIRMLEASKADTGDGPLFLIELFDHDAQSSVDSCICCGIDEGVAAFQDFISR